MRQVWKSYHVFLSGIWVRWTVYLIYPLLLLLGNYWVMGKKEFKPEIGLMICCSLVVTAELFLDYFVFGGIAAKDTNKLEYLKTSPRGLEILKKSLIGDWIRRVICVTVIIMANYVISDARLEWTRLGRCVFCTLFLIELGLIVNRKFSLFGVIVTAITILGMAGVILPIMVMEDVTLSIICTSLWVVLSVVGRMIIMRRAKGSYYDSRD